MATYWENSCSFGLRYVSWYKYLIVSLVFSHLGFWSGNLFLIAPFPDLCLLVPFYSVCLNKMKIGVRKNKCLGTTVLVGNKASFPTGMVDTLARIFSSRWILFIFSFVNRFHDHVNGVTTGLSIMKKRPYNSHQCLRNTKKTNKKQKKTLIVGSC